SYRAVNAVGRIARGQVAAANESELALHLSDAGLELITARTRKERNIAEKITRNIPSRFLPDFAGQMTDLLRAGVPFADALQSLSRAAGSGAMHDALADISRSLNHGCRLATAFSRHPRLFPPVFTSILAAGEASGDLVATFNHLASYTASRARTQ